MSTEIQRLIYTESGGFAGLRRGCTVDAHSLPPEPSEQLRGLLRTAAPAALAPSVAGMPDELLYTLELVTEPMEGTTVATPRSAKGSAKTPKRPQANSPSRALPGPGATDAAPSRPWVLRYSATDVPDNLVALIDYLSEQAKPL